MKNIKPQKFHIVIENFSPSRFSKYSIVYRSKADIARDPEYGVSVEYANSYEDIAKATVGSYHLTSIDRYLLEYYSSQREFFEINGFNPNKKRLKIAAIDRSGYVVFVDPIFQNDELLDKLHLTRGGKIVDRQFTDEFCDLVTNDGDFYRYINELSGKDPIGEDSQINMGVYFLRNSSLNNSTVQNLLSSNALPNAFSVPNMRTKVTQCIDGSYPVYRKLFLATQKYNNHSIK